MTAGMKSPFRKTESSDIAAYLVFAREHRGGGHAHVVLLGLKTFDTIKLLDQVKRGLSYRALERFQKNADLSMEELAALVQIKPRTLARRREEGRLTPEESDHLIRAARVFAKALELFEGDAAAVRVWLATPAKALGGRSPLEVAESEVGAREVENLIGRLEHGVFS